jgi:hypothetical protein
VAAMLLAAGLASSSLRFRGHLRRSRRSAVAAALVVISASAWIVSGPVSVDFGWWLYIAFAGLLLCAVCLPMSVLELDAAPRTAGLAAVTTTGAWLVVTGLEGLIVAPSGYQPGALVTTVVATVVAVGGAWLGQSRSAAPSRGAVGQGAARR